MMAVPRPTRLDVVIHFLDSAELARALALCAIGTSLLAPVLRALIGWPGLIAVVIALTLLCAGSLTVRWRTLEWRGLLTVSLLAFVGWCALSVFWSQYQWATLGGVLYQVCFAVCGVYVALVRDPIQIVRAFGDIIRVMLAASIVLEVLSGLLIDTPLPFLGIAGDLAEGGPIQGLFGSRNLLGFVALVGVITFAVEAFTRSVRRGTSVASLVLGGIVVLLSRSPVTIGTLLLVAGAGLGLLLLRRMSPERRRVGQLVVSSGVVIALITAWVARSPIIDALNAGSEFEYRYGIWRQVLGLAGLHPIEGFGWLGFWRVELPPYIGITGGSESRPSAFNAYLDTLLQVGAVGLVLLLVLLGLAVVRSWLLASQRRSVVYVWPALIAIALMVTSAAESSMIVEFGWLTLVIVAVKGSEGLSWRRGLRDSVDT